MSEVLNQEQLNQELLLLFSDLQVSDIMKIVKPLLDNQDAAQRIKELTNHCRTLQRKLDTATKLRRREQKYCGLDDDYAFLICSRCDVFIKKKWVYAWSMCKYSYERSDLDQGGCHGVYCGHCAKKMIMKCSQCEDKFCVACDASEDPLLATSCWEHHWISSSCNVDC